MRTKFKSLMSSSLSAVAIMTSIAISAIPLTAAAQASATGSVSGVITDATGQTGLAGAVVTLSPSGQRTTTSSDGSWRLNNIEPGTYEVSASWLGGTLEPQTIAISPGQAARLDLKAPATTARAVETIIVVGQRGSLASARAQERGSDQIKTIVSADAIGNFADQNVAESLQRLPGLSIRRSEGEGQQVAVRGLSGSFVTVTVDGAKLGTRDTGSRSVNLDVISSDLLNGIEVTKSLTPDLDADAVAGNVNLRTLSAFARRGDSVSVRAEGSYESKAEVTNPKVSADFTKLFGDRRFGIAGGVSWSQREAVVDEFSVDDGLLVLNAVPAGTSPSSIIAPRRFNLRNDPATRTRLSANLNFEFRPNDADKYFARMNYATFEDQDLRARTRIEFDDATGSRITNATFNSFTGSRIDVEKRFRFTDQVDTLISGSLGGENVRGPWTVQYQGDYSSNESDQPSVEPRFRERDVIAGYSNLSIDGADFTLAGDPARGSNPDNPASFDLRFITDLDIFVEDTVSAAKIDITRDAQMFGRQGSFKFGAKAQSRTKSVDEDRADIGASAPTTLAAFNPSIPRLTDLNVGVFPNFSQLRAYALTEAAAGRAAGRTTELFADSNRNDWNVDESVIAGYAMAKFQPFEDVQVIAGVRVESTQWDTVGNITDVVTYDTAITTAIANAMTAAITNNTATFTAAQRDAYLAPRRNAAGTASIEERATTNVFEGSKSYVNWFPSVNVRWDVDDKVLARASYTTAIQRPDFDQASAVRLLRTQEITNTVSTIPSRITSIAQADALTRFRRTFDPARDPNLEPLKAQQFDFSLSWYPNRNVTASAGFFYKSLTDFIVPTAFSGADVTRLGFTQGNGTIGGGIDVVQTFINGEEASVLGLELAYQQNFVDLPGLLSGLFMSANTTFSESQASDPRIGRKFTLPDQADLIGNLTLGWENKKFSIRWSGNYSGDRLVELNGGFLGLSNPDSDIIERERFAQDVNIRFDLKEGWQIYADAINFTDSEDRQYFRASSLGGIFFLRENYGPTYQFGVRAKF